MDAKKKKGQMDMTEGSPLRMIILFTIPIILGNIFQQLYNIGDAKVVSFYLNEHAFGAVGMTGVISNMIIGLINGFTQGFGILVANAFGAKDTERIRRNIAGAAVLTICVTVMLLTGAFTFIEDILVLVNTPDELISLASRYIRIILVGIPFTALYNLSANVLRSIGDSRTPLYCLIASIFLNIAMDILFVGAFHWNIEGAALATIISQAVCSVSCFLYGVTHFREYMPGKKDFRLKLEEYKKLFYMGLSMGLMGCIVNIGTIVLQSAINGLGADIVAAHTAGRRLLEILMSLIYTYGFTMTTYTSQNAGAGKVDRIRLGVRTAVYIVTVTSAVLILFAFLFAGNIVTWIASSDSTMIAENATMYCKVGVCFFPVLGPLFILRCTLQGVGRKVVPLSSSILELCVKVLSASFLVKKIGYLGIALTEPISWVLMTTILTIGYFIVFRDETKVLKS
ncbi:putative efflux protein, MATE family [Eubacterium ruminantium]|nr:putative efflux protein, MATE family [Eubacterium ruminantium]